MKFCGFCCGNPTGTENRVLNIANAKDYVEGISYLSLSADAKTLVTEVSATCNDYYINDANFLVIAGYLNEKITFLFEKGENMTIEDQYLAAMFTVFKHSYYYWHGTK